MKKELLAGTAIVAAAGLAGFGLAGKVGAQEWIKDLYLGAGPSVAAHDGIAGTSGVDDTVISGLELGGKVYAGWQFHKYGAVEAGYNYFGEAHDTDSDSMTSHGASLSLLGILPVGTGGNLFVRAGAFFGWIQGSDVSDMTHTTEFGVSPVLGVGASIDLGSNAAVRLEMEYVPHVGDGNLTDVTGETTTGDVDVLAFTVSVLWRF